MTVEPSTCPGASHPGPNWQYDYLDFPTAWALAREGLVHTDRRCSYVQTWGALLCDCGAVQAEWARRKAGRTTAHRPKRADITSLELLATVDRCRTQAWEHLIERYPPKVVAAAISRDVDRGFLNYGIALQRPFLTDCGQALLRQERGT